MVRPFLYAGRVRIFDLGHTVAGHTQNHVHRRVSGLRVANRSVRAGDHTGVCAASIPLGVGHDTQKAYAEPGREIGKIRASLLFSLAGARGAVTLAGAMSIPLFLSDGSAFPERDLILLIAMGVILCSLLLTNFALPLIADKKSGAESIEGEEEAYAQILKGVFRELSSRADEETRAVTEVVLRDYYGRL